MLSSLHEFKGKPKLYAKVGSDVLTALLDIAKKRNSTILKVYTYTPDERLEALAMEKVEPHNRSEEEIAGYRESQKIEVE